MFDLFHQIWDRITDTLKQYSLGRQVSILVATLLIVGVSAGLLYWAFQPQYRILYSDLSYEDSGEISKHLQEQNVKYKLEAEGTRILVPANKVYQLRLDLAAKELPGEKGSGWELFDESNLGVTDFVQKLNYKRGLEGELARTILQLDPINAVRVHLVMPEESLFRESQKETVASVMVELKRGQKLREAQVEGITFLVSSAVEGMVPQNVSVVDSKGYVLSERQEDDPMMRMTSTQMEYQAQVENHLAEKGQSLLDKRFGPNRSAIQVTAQMNFSQLERTTELYDPNNPSIRSEEFTTSSSVGSDTSSNSNENSITNYELNLTRERFVNSIGDISRMTVAVMVDGNYNIAQDPQSGEEVRNFVPLSDTEVADIEQTIKSALGFSDQRGDEINVVSVPFQETEMIHDQQMVTGNRWDMMFRYGQQVAALGAVILMLLMMRNFMRKAQVAVSQQPTQRRVTPASPSRPQLQASFEEAAQQTALPRAPSFVDMDDMTDQARSDVEMQEKVKNYATKEPESSAKLVRSWLLD